MSDDCPIPQVPEPTPEQITSAVPEVLKQLNIQACHTTSSATNINAYAGVGIPGFGEIAKTNVSGTGTSASSLGCEDINVIAKSYVVSNEKIRHVMDCNATSIKNVINLSNTLTIRAPRSLWNCTNGLRLSQKIDVNAKIVTELSASSNRAITDVVEAHAANTLDVLQKVVTDVGGSPSAARDITDLRQKVTNKTFTNDISKTITNVINETIAGNRIDLDLEDAVINGEDCIIDQSIIIRLVTKTIMSKSLESVFSDKAVFKALDEITKKFDEQQKGMTEITKANSEWAAATAMTPNTTAMIVIGVVVIAVAFLYFKKGGVSAVAGKPQPPAHVLWLWFFVKLSVILSILLWVIVIIYKQVVVPKVPSSVIIGFRK